MTYDALIKVAPVFTLERFNDPAWTRAGRNLYDAGSLSFAPASGAVPLLVDHDEARTLGVVHALLTVQWTDGPWICASARVSADAPSWLARGTRASFGFKQLHRREVSIRGVSAEVVARALVDEVSVLGPGTKPAEALAEVLTFGPVQRKHSAVVASSERATAGVVIHDYDAPPPPRYSQAEIDFYLSRNRRTPLEKLYNEVMVAKAEALLRR